MSSNFYKAQKQESEILNNCIIELIENEGYEYDEALSNCLQQFSASLGYKDGLEWSELYQEWINKIN